MDEPKSLEAWWEEFTAIYCFRIHDRIDPDIRLAGIILMCDYLNRILDARKKLEMEGETQIASRGIYPSDSLINWMISWLLEDVVEDSLPMPKQLRSLIERQLVGVASGFVLEKGDMRIRDQARRLRDSGTSMRQIARDFGVNVSTVSRWINQPQKDSPAFGRSKEFYEIRAEYDHFNKPIAGRH